MRAMTKGFGCLLLAVLFHATLLTGATPSVAVIGQSAGPTPFIVNVLLVASSPSALNSIQFSITPKPNSVTRPIAATYFSDYLQARGYFDTQTGNITVPVFGLYSDYANVVNLTCHFRDGSSQVIPVGIMTPPFADPCGHDAPMVIQARTNTTALSYDFIQVRSQTCSSYAPFVLDTDGALRWVGTSGQSSLTSGFFDNAFYISYKPSGASNFAGLGRIELDGTWNPLRDYSSIGIVSLHHNLDPGKRGILVEVDTTTQIESTVLEVDLAGNILKRWDVADIISAAMTVGGDDPTQFVKTAPNDWFHNNAVTYRSSDDSLIISGREDFVIALDYETGVIKWILGDTTKLWYQFQSLRNYALNLAPYSLPPIGEHALSITFDDRLLLFDNGRNSLSHTPAGTNRTYSTPRKYDINTQTHTATEVWNYPVGETLQSQFCSSVYEDAPNNYLVDYAILTTPSSTSELIGISPCEDKVFDYRYANIGCSTAYRSTPEHWENLTFTGAAAQPLAKTAAEMESASEDSETVASLAATNSECVNDSVVGTGNSQWEYGAEWSYGAANGFEQDEHYAFTTGAVAHFRFNGTQVRIYTVKDPAGGNVGYSLDGGQEQVVSNYSPAPIGNSLSFSSPTLGAGDHDLVIRVVGSHEPNATSNTITVDKAEVFHNAVRTKISVVASPRQITERGTARFTITRSATDPFNALIVNYSMSGTAILGMDYNLSGLGGQVIIPAAQSSATVTLSPTADQVPERAERAKMRLLPGSDYTVARKGASATVKITNSP